MLSLKEDLAHRMAASGGVDTLCQLCSSGGSLPDDAVESALLSLTNIACLQESYRMLIVDRGYVAVRLPVDLAKVLPG